MDRLKTKEMRGFAAALVVALLAAWGCSTNPATGRPQLALISEQQEIEIGRDYDQRIQSVLGVYPDPALQEYVERIGRKLAAGSERPDLAWTFRVVDDPVVNAFALPGGHVYVTRGLMTHLTSEAQLAAVLGHEIGHVTARHAVTQLSKARIARIGLFAGALLSPALAGYAARSLDVLFLKYSRDDERQADDLGLRYMAARGYDPREMPRVFEVLRRVSEGQGGQRIPEWQSTHPSEEERIRATGAAVARLGDDFQGRTVNREGYLRSLDHVAFGQNPREGYFLGSTFVQPALAAEIRFPEGWKTANGRSSVEAVAPKQDAVLVMTLSGETSWRKAAREFFLHEGSQNGETLVTEVNGQPGVVRTFGLSDTEAGDLQGVAGFVEYGGRVYQILGITRAEDWQRYQEALTAAVESFRPETDRRLLDVQPKRLEIVTLPAAMTLEEFSRRYPSTVDLKTLALINQAEAATSFAAGDEVKRVVGGELPEGAKL
ncbi:MAG TPA: M48 family metalloprotease [Thermoanaerobaculia bacterium]|nr:M48 family metalloprotease [Thermoanaerobaculia bacterium]